jgi:hypothetical protein
MLISKEYQQLQEHFHQTAPHYGVSGRKHVEPVLDFAEKLKTKDILDYGCGKATLQKGIPFPIQNYDPCNEEYKTRPRAAELVVCTDVLEHIEIECLKDVLDDIRSLTKRVVYLNVACGPANKVLPDGRNAHLIQETPNWWLSWLLPRFNLISFQASKTEFFALLEVNEITN